MCLVVRMAERITEMPELRIPSPTMVPIAPPPDTIDKFVAGYLIVWIMVAIIVLVVYFIVEVAEPLFDWFFDTGFPSEFKPKDWASDMIRIAFWPYYVVGISIWFVMLENRWVKGWRKKRKAAAQRRINEDARNGYGL